MRLNFLFIYLFIYLSNYLNGAFKGSMTVPCLVIILGMVNFDEFL